MSPKRSTGNLCFCSKPDALAQTFVKSLWVFSLLQLVMIAVPFSGITQPNVFGGELEYSQFNNLNLAQRDSVLLIREENLIQINEPKANSKIVSHLVDLYNRLANTPMQEKLILMNIENAKKLNSDSLLYISQCQLIEIYSYQHKMKKADSVISLIKKNQRFMQDWRGKQAIAIHYKLKKNVDQSERYFGEAINITSKYNLYHETFKLKESQAELYMIELKLDLGIEAINDALNYYRKHKLESSNYLCFKLLGEYYFFNSEYLKAIDSYKNASERAEEHHEYHGYSMTLIRLGGLYQQIALVNMALSNYSKVIEYARKYKDRKGEAVAYYYMAGSYMYENKEYEVAERMFQRANKIFRELGSEDFVLLTKIYEVRSLIYQKKYTLAKTQIDSIKIDPESSLKYGQITYYLVYGQLSIQSGKEIQKGIQFTKKGLSLIRETGITDASSIWAYNNLCEGYEQLGDMDQAYFYKNKAYDEQKLIYNSKRIQQTLSAYYNYQAKSKATIDSLKIVTIESENLVLNQKSEFRKNLLLFLGGFIAILGIFISLLYRTSKKLKKSRLALENSYKELQTITNAVPVGMCKIDLDLNVLWSNEQIRKFHNLSEKEAENINFKDAIPQSSVDIITDLLSTNKKKESISFESALNPDLSVAPKFEAGMLWAKVVYIPLLNAKGRIKNYIVLQDDRTAEKLRELEIYKQKVELETIANSVPIGLCKLDKNLDVIWANPFIKELYNVPESPDEKYNYKDVLSPTVYAYVIKMLEEIENKDILVFEGAMDKDGAVSQEFENGMSWLKVSYIPIRNEDGEIEEFIVLNDDHTNEKVKEYRIESQKNIIEDMNMRLKEKSSTIANQNKELEQLNHKLRISNESLSQFSSIAAHDLKAPLRTITMFNQMLSKKYQKEITEEDKKSFDLIIDSCRTLRDMIDGLLNYSKVSNDQVTFDIINLETIILRALKKLDSFIREKRAKITLPDTFPNILGHSSLFEQIFLNIIINALKFCSPGTIPDINISWEDHNEHFVKISISDNGIGIAKKYHQEIFMVYRRLNTSGRYKGNGIGLATCKKIIETYGGKIGLESQPGEGTTFYLLFQKESNPDSVLSSKNLWR